MSECNYRLQFTSKAAKDLDAIYDYIFNTLSATMAANDLLEHIEKATRQLTVFPYSGPHVLEESLRMKGYRKIIVDNYLLFYVVDETEKQVVVIRVLFGASKYEKIL
jgi:addiction module toxin, RelE/StbE family